MQAELRDLERAVASGTREAGQDLKTELRRQVGSAGLGQRLANSWRDKHYPNQRLDAASLVYTKAPQIIRAFDEGAVIRSRRGRFLAIPTENAPRKGTDGRRISPRTFPEHRLGRCGADRYCVAAAIMRRRRTCRPSCATSSARWRAARATPAAASRPSCAGRWRAPGSASGSPTAGATSTTRTRSSTPRAWSTPRRRRSSARSTRAR